MLPGGARMVVWVIVNVEEWDPQQPMPRTVLTPPAGGQPSPDIPNWAWHEYGNRVGFWRMLEALDDNGAVIASYEPIARAARPTAFISWRPARQCTRQPPARPGTTTPPSPASWACNERAAMLPLDRDRPDWNSQDVNRRAR